MEAEEQRWDDQNTALGVHYVQPATLTTPISRDTAVDNGGVEDAEDTKNDEDDKKDSESDED